VHPLGGFLFFQHLIFLHVLIRMKSFMKLGGAIALGCFAVESAARAIGGSPNDWIKPYRREALQDIVLR
jgi:hypothetical protein